jgi:hypothetical protein
MAGLSVCIVFVRGAVSLTQRDRFALTRRRLPF